MTANSKDTETTEIFNPVSDPDLARLHAFQNPGVVNESIHLLRSGIQHNYYIDIDPNLNDPAESERIMQWYVKSIEDIRRNHINEPLDFLAFIEKDRESGGTIGILRLSGAISIATLTPNIIVRLSKEIVSERIKFRTSSKVELSLNSRFSGYRFAILTDHCTTGDEILTAISTIESYGGLTRHLLSYSIISKEFKWSTFSDKSILVHCFLSAPEDLNRLDLLKFELKQL